MPLAATAALITIAIVRPFLHTSLLCLSRCLLGRVVRKLMWDKVYNAQVRAGVEPTGILEMPTVTPGIFYGHS